MNAVLQVDGLHKAFGGVQAVEDVSFAVSAGDRLPCPSSSCISPWTLICGVSPARKCRSEAPCSSALLRKPTRVDRGS